jgi:hypothetical protein
MNPGGGYYDPCSVNPDTEDCLYETYPDECPLDCPLVANPAGGYATKMLLNNLAVSTAVANAEATQAASPTSDEYDFTIYINSSGDIVPAPLTDLGSSTGGNITNNLNSISSFRTHNTALGPSPKDIIGLIDINQGKSNPSYPLSNYTVKYNSASDGLMYGTIINDPSLASAFWDEYSTDIVTNPTSGANNGTRLVILAVFTNLHSMLFTKIERL